MTDRRFLVQYKERHKNKWEDHRSSQDSVLEACRLLSDLIRTNNGNIEQARVVSLWWMENSWKMKDVLMHRDLNVTKN